MRLGVESFARTVQDEETLAGRPRDLQLPPLFAVSLRCILLPVPPRSLESRFLSNVRVHPFVSYQNHSESMPLSDGDLVERSRRGDGDAFEQLLRRHIRAAYAVALAALADPADADDVCQEAYITALRKLDGLREPEKFRGWLLQIVRHRAIDFQRKENPQSQTSLDGLYGVAGPGGPAQDADRSELRERLIRALGTLPEREQEIVLLHDMEGWRHREIAEKLGIPEGTVRYLLSTARKTLRGELEEDLLET